MEKPPLAEGKLSRPPPHWKAPTQTRGATPALGSELSHTWGSPKGLGDAFGAGGTQVGRRCTWPPMRATASWSLCFSQQVPGAPDLSTPLIFHALGHTPLRRAACIRSRFSIEFPQ